MSYFFDTHRPFMSGDSSFTEQCLTKAVPLLGLTRSPEATEVCPTSNIRKGRGFKPKFMITINSQPSTVNRQQSTINSQQSTVNTQQSTVNSQQTN